MTTRWQQCVKQITETNHRWEFMEINSTVILLNAFYIIVGGWVDPNLFHYIQSFFFSHIFPHFIHYLTRLSWLKGNALGVFINVLLKNISWYDEQSQTLLHQT